MSDIPSDLLPEIFIHLSAESLLRFRAVCREWLSIIDSPYFIKSHTHYSNNSNTYNTLLLRDSNNHRHYLLSLDSHFHSPQAIDLTRIKTLAFRGVSCDYPPPSCHGLILLSYDNIETSWALWNPLTRKYRRLLKFSYLSDVSIKCPNTGVGIGYDCVSDDYKVVKIDACWNEERKHILQTLVYSLKSGSWKVMKDRISFLNVQQRNGVYLNGALYWICENVIMVLDLGSEVYRFLPLPPLPLSPVLDMCIHAMDGCLFVTFYYMSEEFLYIDDDWRMDEFCLEGWFMKDDGNWTRCFWFEEKGRSLDVIRDLVPVAFLKSRGYVFLQKEDQIYWIGVNRNIKRRLIINGLPEYFTCQSFRGSLVRLLDGVGGKPEVNKKKKNKKNRAQKNMVQTPVTELCDDDGGGAKIYR